MTNPVILLGTQSNGETLPVQVDATGRLVAEGVPGSQGPEGPPGGAFPLPADPYEGAFLGWLNGELAWIGTPPVPIPPGVFGPITGWDSQNSLLTVEGEIPAEVGNGVYVYQCERDGTYFTAGWNTKQIWSNNTTAAEGFEPDRDFNGEKIGGAHFMYDGNLSTSAATININSNTTGDQTAITIWFDGQLEVRQSLRLFVGDAIHPQRYTVQCGDKTVAKDIDGEGTWVNCSSLVGVTITSTTPLVVKQQGVSTANWVRAIEVDGNRLVDPNKGLNFRVQNVIGQSLLGIPSTNDPSFTIGKYLYIPQQRVAPWVLYENDPTSFIDHLRSK